MKQREGHRVKIVTMAAASNATKVEYHVEHIATDPNDTSKAAWELDCICYQKDKATLLASLLDAHDNQLRAIVNRMTPAQRKEALNLADLNRAAMTPEAQQQLDQRTAEIEKADVHPFANVTRAEYEGTD